MGKENIEKYSARYALLKSVAGFWHNNVFYRKVIVLGRENINPNDPLIFAPNHQNALMDALAVLFTHKGQPIFLARADIFKRKTIAAVLYFLKILPVYRLRDGFSSLKSNDEIFVKTIDVLKNKNGVVILPEGDHAGFRRLRQLKKGICRVAFQSDEATGFNLKVKIIPVGLEFSKLFRDRILVNKMNLLKSTEPSLYHRICSLSLEIKSKAKELRTDYRLLEKRKHPLGWLVAGMIGILITFPLFIYGNIFNLTFLEIPNLQIRKIKDPQFHSSIRYGISLALAFVFLPLYLIISLFIFSSWWLGLLIFLTLPASGLFAWNYYLQYRRIKGGFRIRKMISQNDKEFDLLRRNHTELIKLIATLHDEE